MSRHRDKGEIIYDILDALQCEPLLRNRLFIKSNLNGGLRKKYLPPLIEKGFIEDWYEPRVSGYKGEKARKAIERGAPPVNRTKHFYKITPKGMALLIAIHKAKVMLGG